MNRNAITHSPTLPKQFISLFVTICLQCRWNKSSTGVISCKLLAKWKIFSFLWMVETNLIMQVTCLWSTLAINVLVQRWIVIENVIRCHQNVLFPGIHLCPSLFLIFERPLVQKFSYGYHLNWRYLSQIFPVCCWLKTCIWWLAITILQSTYSDVLFSAKW